MAYPPVSSVFRRFRPRRGFFCLVLLACCALSASASTAQVWMQKLVPAIQVQAATPMLPYLDWLLDPSGRFTVEEVAMPERQTLFRPLNMDKLPHESGTVWLRFTLAQRPLESRPSTLLLDLGEGVPATPTLYVPKRTMTPGVTEWQDFTPSQRAVFLMPDAQSTAVTAYIKMDGLPGIWFDPMLRTPHNAATAMERLARPAVIVALAVVMLLCLLRGLSERGEWRIWTGCYTGAALLYAVWGAPATPYGHVAMADIGAVLAPGVALMLLPHVGRHLMRTRTRARVYDIQYFILTLPGALLALAPLAPGFSWTCRYLELWPLGTLLLAPTTVGAWLSGLPGARRFLLGCLAPAVGTALGVIGIGSPVPEPLLATAPLWGLALGALIIAGTATTRDQLEDEVPSAADAPSAPSPDPDLRIITHDDPPEGAMLLPVSDAPSARTQVAPARSESTENQVLDLEKRLRAPLDVLLREGTALGECSLPPVARQHAEAMVNAVRSMAVTLADPVRSEAPPAAMDNGEQVFDLQQMLREAHDNVAVSAENKNVALSWFMPPYLPQRYEGDGTRLSQVLRMLLESSVRATGRGAVQLAVRRVPESVDPGHLLFTVTDTGDGVPPAERSSLALARAWELAGAHKGFLGVESSPQGASISFTVRLGVHQGDVSADSAEIPAEQNAPRGIILADDSPSNRQLLSFFLEGLPYQTREARTAEEAAELFMQAPAALLVFDGDMFAEQTLSAVSRIREFERGQGLPPACVLALTEDDSRWDALHEAGFTHALTKPVTRSGLRKTVLELLPPAGGDAAPSFRPSPQEDAPTDGLPPLSMEPTARAPREDDDVVIDTGLPLPASAADPAVPASAATAESPLRMTAAAQSAPMPEAPLRMTPPAAPQSGAQPLPSMRMSPASEGPLRMTEPAQPDAIAESPLQMAAPTVSIVAEDAPLRMTPLQAQPQTASRPQDAMEDLLTDLFGPEEPLVRPPARPTVSTTPTASREPLRMTPPAQAGEWVGEPMPAGAPASSPSSVGAPAPGNFEPLHFGPSAEGNRPASSESRPMRAAPATVRTAPVTPAAPQTVSVRPTPAAPAFAPSGGESLEWVGEPMPVGTPMPRAVARPAAQGPFGGPSVPVSAPRPAQVASPTGSDWGDEWVGEPMPVPRTAPQAPASPSAGPELRREAPSAPQTPFMPPPAQQSAASAPGMPRPASVAHPSAPAASAGRPTTAPEQETAFIPLTLEPPSQESVRQTPGRQPELREPPRQAVPRLVAPTASPRPLVQAVAPATPRPGTQAPTPSAPQTARPKPQAPQPPQMGQTTPSVYSGGPSVASDAARNATPSTAQSGDDGASLPPIAGLLVVLDAAMFDARTAFAQGDPSGVQTAAGSIASHADSCGLRVLARMARCVEGAAKARDRDALTYLLPELETAVERNRIALMPKK